MNSLPTEIGSMILSYVNQEDLYACRLINRRFFAIGTPNLWRQVHLQNTFTGTSFLHSLVTARYPVGDFIRSIQLQDYPWTDDNLLTLLRRTPFLTNLVLDNATRITDSSMQHLARYCPQIQSLYLAGSAITHVSYRVLGQFCMNLTDLSLWNCPGLLPSTFTTHFVRCPLERLTLAIMVPDDDPQYLFNMINPFLINEATLDLTRLHHLTHLRIHGSPFGMVKRVIDYHGGGDGLNLCMPYLTCLELEACFDVTDSEAIRFIQALSTSGGANLDRLALKDGAFTNETLDTISFYLPNLIELDVSANILLTPIGIRRLIHHCRHLSLIDLSYCGLLMDDFPEAGFSCADTVRIIDGRHIELDHLDEEAIGRIRRTGF